ncbi:hypothetical protein N1I86_10505 [Bacillus sp. FSL W8-0116]|uniref:hypothetical protein n=1 Tax=Bacillus sp. FSL W8-0116 TaxID=2978206 RepID=UPI0030F69DD3
MNYTQNQKISQITPSTLIVGIDVAKEKHVARFQDDRGFSTLPSSSFILTSFRIGSR